MLTPLSRGEKQHGLVGFTSSTKHLSYAPCFSLLSAMLPLLLPIALLLLLLTGPRYVSRLLLNTS